MGICSFSQVALKYQVKNLVMEQGGTPRGQGQKKLALTRIVPSSERINWREKSKMPYQTKSFGTGFGLSGFN